MKARQTVQEHPDLASFRTSMDSSSPAHRRDLGFAREHLHHRRVREPRARSPNTIRTGDWVKSWGSKGTGPGQFRIPHAIVADRNNNLYVGDRTNRRIQVFDTDGKLLRMFTIDVPPVPGTHAVNGNTPTGERLAAVIGAPNSRSALRPWSRIRCCSSARAPSPEGSSKLASMAKFSESSAAPAVSSNSSVGSAPACLCFGKRSVRCRDVQLARPEIDPASANAAECEPLAIDSCVDFLHLSGSWAFESG